MLSITQGRAARVPAQRDWAFACLYCVSVLKQRCHLRRFLYSRAFAAGIVPPEANLSEYDASAAWDSSHAFTCCAGQLLLMLPKSKASTLHDQVRSLQLMRLRSMCLFALLSMQALPILRQCLLSVNPWSNFMLIYVFSFVWKMHVFVRACSTFNT